MKSGFVAILGMPNTGKSSLLNCIVGQKVSIVSKKPQTTRNRILGIYNAKDTQMVFCDTPGLIDVKSNGNALNALSSLLVTERMQGAKGADIIMIVVAADKGISEREKQLINRHSKKSCVVVVVNKIDLVNYEKLFPLLKEIQDILGVADIVPVSAYKKKNIDGLLKVLKSHLNEGQCFFDDDLVTDKSLRFMAAELIREKALSLLNDEVPHGIFVEIEAFDEKPGLTTIEASIVCEKENHKAIIIGKNGSKIKEIGTRARIPLEKMLETKVMLKLFVKVREGWRDNKSKVDELK